MYLMIHFLCRKLKKIIVSDKFFQIWHLFIFYRYCNYKQIRWRYTGNAFLELKVPLFKTVLKLRTYSLTVYRQHFSGPQVPALEPQTNIRGHKGHNSTGTRCRDFLVLEYRCRGFLFSEKMSWNLDVVVFWSWILDVAVFWSWNLNIVDFWSWDFDVVVYVSPRPRFRFHCENRKNHAKLFQLYCWRIFQLSKFMQQLSA